MNYKLKQYLLLVLMAAGTSSFAQHIDSFDVRAGINQFVLGSDKSIYGNTIRLPDTINYGGITDYISYYQFEKPYMVAGVQFYGVILTFDVNCKLKQIELMNLYTDKLFSKYKQLAHRDFNHLAKFLQSRWGKMGAKKNQFNHLIAKGYEWSGRPSKMWMYLQETKSPIKNIATHYSISIVFIRNN